MRASDLLGRTVLDEGGRRLGRIVDILTEPDEQGRAVLVAGVVVRGPWGRLLGYEREQLRGPWLLDWPARKILRRNQRSVPWAEIRFAGPPE
jgi:sporulation protein YlmC with PRC-barrel domain